jgi:hypothetical protein
VNFELCANDRNGGFSGVHPRLASTARRSGGIRAPGGAWFLKGNTVVTDASFSMLQDGAGITRRSPVRVVA